MPLSKFHKLLGSSAVAKRSLIFGKGMFAISPKLYRTVPKRNTFGRNGILKYKVVVAGHMIDCLLLKPQCPRFINN